MEGTLLFKKYVTVCFVINVFFNLFFRNRLQRLSTAFLLSSNQWRLCCSTASLLFYGVLAVLKPTASMLSTASLLSLNQWRLCCSTASLLFYGALAVPAAYVLSMLVGTAGMESTLVQT